MTQKPFIEYNTVPLPDHLRGWLMRPIEDCYMIIGDGVRAVALIPPSGNPAKDEHIASVVSMAPETLRLLELFVEQTLNSQTPDLGEARSLISRLRPKG